MTCGGMSKLIWIFFLILQAFIAFVTGSTGDRSPVFNECSIKCHNSYCKNDDNYKNSSSILTFFVWNCDEDCNYKCMWQTVEYFVKQDVTIPQFYGKWPFIRLFGCQEPASVFFSILNFYIHCIMYWKFKKKVRSTYPMFYIWTYFSIICLHSWFWSAIFHARDRQFTEVMDYSCAFTTVLTLLCCTLLRIVYKNSKVYIVIICVYFSTLYTHLSHLWSGSIDYGYNMKFNIIVGFLTFALTMIWWYYNKHKLSHIYLIGWFNLLVVLVTLLEVADFPPIFWIFDAHSLWHACTAPLTILLYRFMILDCLYLKMRHSKTILNADHLN